MRKMRLVVAVGGAAVAAGGVFATSAHADIRHLFANLDGNQEVPPVQTPGTGFANITLNVLTGDIEVSGTFRDLTSPATVAHIHGPGGVGVNAPVILPLTIDQAVSGSFSAQGTFNPTQVQWVLDELTYINIHNQPHPGGEIRGQIIPGPATLALLGLGGLVATRRRRRCDR